MATRMLTGDTDAAAAAARARPVTGLGGEFAPAPQKPQERRSRRAFPTAGGCSCNCRANGRDNGNPHRTQTGDIMPGQRGAVGEPVNIGPLRALQNQPRTYKNGPIESPKGAAKKPGAANDKKFGPLRRQPADLRRFSRENLGDNFSWAGYRVSQSAASRS